VAQAFCRHNSLEPEYGGPPNVKFLGVFDTVGALGIPIAQTAVFEDYRWHKVHLSDIVQHAYHAVAIGFRVRDSGRAGRAGAGGQRVVSVGELARLRARAARARGAGVLRVQRRQPAGAPSVARTRSNASRRRRGRPQASSSK
jgi:hypothetical protein